MPDYGKGKIYKIINNSSDLVYFGATIQPLYKRFNAHKSVYSGCTSKTIFEGENPQIILVEKFACNDKQELKKRERYYIENNDCINKNIPGRTVKEYKQDNKEKCKEYEIQYRNDNKDKIKEYYLINKERIIEKNRLSSLKYQNSQIKVNVNKLKKLILSF